jgi:hypothetical protein
VNVQVNGGAKTFVAPSPFSNDIYQYILWHNRTAKPSTWTYRPRSWSVDRDSSSDGRH